MEPSIPGTIVDRDDHPGYRAPQLASWLAACWDIRTVEIVNYLQPDAVGG
jgi:hypothetical protein